MICHMFNHSFCQLIPLVMLPLLAACQVAKLPDQAQTTANAPASLPSPQCEGEVPATVMASLRGARVATAADFVKSIREFASPPPKEPFTCTVYTADFNGDRRPDYALLLVNPQTLGSAFRLMLSQTDGQFKPAISRNFNRPPAGVDGLIYTAMFFKPAGAEGVAQRSYFPLKPGTPERTAFIAIPAIELWRPVVHYKGETFKPKDLATIDGLAYCSEVFYFMKDEMKTTRVCD
jgi:hypothetical protein